MFERFTERARQVVVLAQDESRLLAHGYLGTEHLLLGLIREEESLAARALRAAGVELSEVRDSVERIVGRGEVAQTGQIPFTPRAKRALELALQEALGLAHGHIGTEHILLGLLQPDGDSVAVAVLTELGIAPDSVRQELLASFAGERPSQPGPLRRRRGLRFEYRVEPVADEDAITAAWLNELGDDGWELAAVVPRAGSAAAIFKRPRLD